MNEENNIINELNEESGKKNNFKINSSWIYTALIIIFFLWFIFGGGERKQEIQTEENKDQTTSEKKEDEKNSEIAVVEKDSNLKEVLISENSYIPVSNIYNNKDSYNKNTFRISLKGEFNEAKLIIKGKTENDLKNFLSINLGVFSGNYIIEKGFDKDNQLSVSVDLKKEENFIEKDKVVLWKYIEPASSKDNATIVRVYATIFDEKGQYANKSEITELKFAYSCDEKDPECKAVVCNDSSKSGGSCLVDEFGLDASKNYINYFTR